MHFSLILDKHYREEYTVDTGRRYNLDISNFKGKSKSVTALADYLRRPTWL